MELGAVSLNSNMNAANTKNLNKTPYFCGKANPLEADTVSFSGKNKLRDANRNKKSGFVHKALIASTNCLFPGLGQAINGQWGKAALFAIGAPVAVLGAMTVSLPLALGIGAVAEAAMFIDAYRNA